MDTFGADLGSESTYLVDSSGDIVRNELGGHSSGTLVAFSGGERVIGEAAVATASMNPKNTVGQLHLLLGHSSHESFSAAHPIALHLPFKRETAATVTTSGSSDRLVVSVDYSGLNKATETGQHQFLPESILAMLLFKVKSLATSSRSSEAPACFGLAVPPWLSPEAKQALRDAATIAGIDKVVLVEGPEALCRVLAKKHPLSDEEGVGSKVVLMVDVGASHATVTCARFFAAQQQQQQQGPQGEEEEGAEKPPPPPLLAESGFEVLSSCSDPMLGVATGVDATALFPLVREKAFAKLGGEKACGCGLEAFACPGSKAGLRLLRGVDKLRKLLSTMPTAEVTIENVFEDSDVKVSLSRQEMKEACEACGYSPRFRGLLAKALADAHVDTLLKSAEGEGGGVDSLETLGGGSRMPLLQEMIASALGSKSGDDDLGVTFGQKLDSAALSYGAALAAAAASEQQKRVAESVAKQTATPEEGSSSSSSSTAAAEAAATTESAAALEEAPEAPPVEAAAEAAGQSGGKVDASPPPPATETEAPAAAAAAADEETVAGGLSAEVLSSCAQAEKAMQTKDEALRAVAEARNAIESYVLERRQAPLHPKHGDKVTNRAALDEALDEAEGWLYSEEAAAASVEDAQLRLSALKHMVDDDLCKDFLAALQVDRDTADAEMEAAAKAEEALKFAAAGEMEEEGESRADKDNRRLSKAERMKKVMKHKETGTELFKGKNYLHAAKHYKDALSHAGKFVEVFEPGSAEEAEVKGLKVTLLMNLATCWTKLDNMDQVLKCANDALALDPNAMKALFRRAMVLEKRGDFAGAKKDLDAALKQPGGAQDTSVATLVKRVDIQIRREKEKEKKMYGKMFA